MKGKGQARRVDDITGGNGKVYHGERHIEKGTPQPTME
jgi:hypothetical protein